MDARKDGQMFMSQDGKIVYANCGAMYMNMIGPCRSAGNDNSPGIFTKWSEKQTVTDRKGRWKAALLTADYWRMARNIQAVFS